MKLIPILVVVAVLVAGYLIIETPFSNQPPEVDPVSAEDFDALGGEDSDGSELVGDVDNDPPAQPIEQTQFDEGASAGTTEAALNRPPEELLTVEGFEFVAVRNLIESSDLPAIRKEVLVDSLNNARSDEEQLESILAEVREELEI
ncbi:hypothetical protein [Marinovum sp.]|uniref:hypothetical protein n=1 Tax=Marinovum sp. TaxID=2024839 RepID=UPI002B2726BE|nr:hypothetical protein [Marinovum sp.]